MKVRNKHNREMIVDLGEQWEPESSGIEEMWRDVTDECVAVPCGDDIAHRGGIILQEKGYRLRKVRLFNSSPQWNRDDKQWAFIVEQKVTQ